MSRKRKPERPEWDDGHTIANMNVEGMPWYKDEKPKAPAAQDESLRLTREESRYYTWGALKAAMVVVGVMSLGIVIFVAFCVWVWFR